MNKLRRSIPFIGERNYIHGPDIYYALLDALKVPAGENPLSLKFNIHGFIETNHVDITVHENSREVDRAAPISTLELNGGAVAAMRPAETEAGGNALRKTSHEAEIVAALSLDDWTTRSPRLADASPLEQAVLMKKELLARNFPDAGVKWAFCRAEFDTPFTEEPARISVECATRQPSRLYKSEVSADGARVGDIYFVGIK